MKKLFITTLNIFVLIALSYAQESHRVSKKPTKKPQYYWVALTYYDNHRYYHKVVSDIGEPVLFNEDIEARIMDDFEESSNPLRDRHFVDRQIYKFNTYKDASSSRHHTLDSLYNNKFTSNINENDREFYEMKESQLNQLNQTPQYYTFPSLEDAKNKQQKAKRSPIEELADSISHRSNQHRK